MKSFELLSKITINILSTDDFDLQINSILEIVGKYLNISNAYLILNNDKKNVITHTYEWCSEFNEPSIEKLKHNYFEVLSSLEKYFSKNGKININATDELSADFLSILDTWGIKSQIISPIFIGESFQGVIGLIDLNENYNSQDLVQNLLKTLSCLISVVYEKKKYQDNLKKIETECKELKFSSRMNNIFCDIIGASREIEDVFIKLEKVIDKEINFLLLGESGTGKELFAKAIHNARPDRKGPLIIVNCSAISESLAESLLFGHRKGAFTGALSDSVGYFEQAYNGTIFLDEIGDMPIEIQAKILRVIEDKKIKPLGDSREKTIDCRIISATNVNLEEAVIQKKFRNDLFYRINEFPVIIPALRQRKGDIPLLCKYFINSISKFYEIENITITDAALSELENCRWPGNIRELKGTIQKLVLTCQGMVIDRSDVLLNLNKTSLPDASNTFTNAQPLEDTEKNIIIKVFEDNNRNVEKTAEILNKGRTTIYRKLKKYGIL